MWRGACRSWKTRGEWVQTHGRTMGAEIVFHQAVWTKPVKFHMKGSPRHTRLVLRNWNLCINMWQPVVTRNYSYHRKCCWSPQRQEQQMRLVPTALTSLRLCLCYTDPRVYFIDDVLSNKRDWVNWFDSKQTSQQDMENNMFRAEGYGGV